MQLALRVERVGKHEGHWRGRFASFGLRSDGFPGAVGEPYVARVVSLWVFGRLLTVVLG